MQLILARDACCFETPLHDPIAANTGARALLGPDTCVCVDTYISFAMVASRDMLA